MKNKEKANNMFILSHNGNIEIQMHHKQLVTPYFMGALSTGKRMHSD